MLRNIWVWILQNVFHIQTETKPREVEDNEKYAVEYERIDEINFNSIFSNKLANYVINDSNLNILGENDRTELLSKTSNSMWKKAKKLTSMSFGYGGIFLVPYVRKAKLYYSVVPQSRVTIDKTEGDLITGATILAEKKEITGALGQTKIYIRWTNYRLDENNNCIIEQKFTDETGRPIPTPDFWRNIMLKQTITNVDRVLLGYIKSPINNRKINDKYGVPITYGCESTILEIKETMKQIYREYKLKEAFVGADVTMFNGQNALPTNGLFKKIDSGTDDFFEVFDPAFRPFDDRLQELYKRLEHEIGTSAGILSDVETSNATATEIKRSMYDTFTIVDDMRTNIEKAMDDFFYACNVLANAYNLSSQGDYELDFNWSYSLLEDPQQEFSQLMSGINQGVVKKVEVRQWLFPDEELEDSQKAVDEIKKEEPDIQDLLGTKNRNND
jgi:hypothetical protein